MAAFTVYKHRAWASPFCTQGTYMPSSGSFVTMYLAELHFGNGYMEIGLLISSLHVSIYLCHDAHACANDLKEYAACLLQHVKQELRMR